MNAKSQNSPQPWVDPDDAPELTDEFFKRGEWKVGDRPVSPQEGAAELKKALARGRPPIERPKVSVTVRYDADVVAAFKASGRGWQTRMNEVLREWLKSHPAP